MRVIQEDGNYFGENRVLGIGNAKPELKYGKVAKELREKANLTIEELSKELSVKAKLIEEIENQTKGMSEDTMQRYIDKFNVKKEDFFDMNTARLILGENGVVLKTFETAGHLIQFDFDRNAVYDGMYEMDRKLLHLQGYLYQNFVIDEHGAAYIKVTNDVLRQFEVTPSETSLLVGSLGNVKGICAWVIFIEEGNTIRVRLRSKGPIINQLAKKYNGGGHPLASGASANSWEEADHVIEDLKEICRDYK